LKKLIAFVAGLAMASSMLVTPTLATTSSGAHEKNPIDCLGLLFGDPKVREAECGPFTQPPFWFPTGGSGPGTCAQVTELVPTIHPDPWVRDDGYVVVAQTVTCCSGLGSSLSPGQLPDWTGALVYDQRLLVAGC
jgi:hypothetical protein